MGQGGDGQSANKCGICEKDGETAKCGHCNKMLCPNCRKSHLTQLKFDIGRSVNQIRRGLPKLSESIAGTEQKSEQIKQHVEGVKAEVRDVVARYMKQMKDREKMLNSELDTFLQGETRNLRLKQENTEVELASLSSYCDSMEGLLNRAADEIPDTELVTIKQQCSEYMDQLRNTDDSSGPNPKVIKLDFEGQQLNSCIMNFASLAVTTPGTSGGAGTSNGNARNQSETQRSRPRWSSPQPLHELVSREVNTPPPASPPHSTRPPVFTPSPITGLTPRPVGIGPHNAHLIPSYLRSPHHTQGNSLPLTPRHDALNTNRYMYRMAATSPDNALQTLEQYLRNSEFLNSPRPNRISPIFGAYNTSQEEQDRSPGVVSGFRRGGVARGRGRGYNRRNDDTIIATGGTTGSNNSSGGTTSGNTNSSFSGRNRYPDIDHMDIDHPRGPAAAAAEDAANDIDELLNRAADNRQAVAFSVDFDESPNRRGSRRRQPQRNRGGRNANRRSRNSDSNRESDATRRQARENSRNREEPQPSTSTGRTAGGGQATNASPGRYQLSRNRTFVMDQEEGGNSNNNNNNSNSNSEIARPNIDSDEDLDGIDILSSDAASASESLTVSRSANKYKKKGSAKKVIGGARSSEPGMFTWPRGVAVSSNNDSIIVADSSNHRIQIFDCNGGFVNEFGAFGTTAGDFDCLAGVTCSRNGNIVVSDRYNHRIQIFDRYGQLKKTFGREGIGHGQLSYPWGVVTSQNHVFIVDKENHRIQVFTKEGTFVRVFGRFGEEPGNMNHPTYIALTPDNKVVVSDTDNHRVQVFTAEGEHVTQFGSHGSETGQMQNPKGVAVDKQGFIIVADSGNNRIQVFRGDGRFYTAFGSHGTASSQFKAIEGVALTTDGKIVVSDKENHRIQLF